MSEITCQRLTDGRFLFVNEHGHVYFGRSFPDFSEAKRAISDRFDWATNLYNQEQMDGHVAPYRAAYVAMLQREELEGDAAKLECQHCGGKILYVHMRSAAKDATVQRLCGALEGLIAMTPFLINGYDEADQNRYHAARMKAHEALERARGEGRGDGCDV
jgi:DNA-directed RNA polymerase subunit RPC12/RpoP